MPTIVYNRWLRIALEKVDAFFGDAGRKDSSWIARALHLETDGPRWTAPAFDRCLLLALIYPIVTVFAVWAFSGHMGLAERALVLPPDDPASRHPDLWRGLSFLSAAFCGYAWYRSGRAHGPKSTVLWAVVVALSFPLSLSLALALALSLALSLSLSPALALTLALMPALSPALSLSLSFSLALSPALSLSLSRALALSLSLDLHIGRKPKGASVFFYPYFSWRRALCVLAPPTLSRR
jgi:ABC-type sugar transport system permease subunit